MNLFNPTPEEPNSRQILSIVSNILVIVGVMAMLVLLNLPWYVIFVIAILGAIWIGNIVEEIDRRNGGRKD